MQVMGYAITECAKAFKSARQIVVAGTMGCFHLGRPSSPWHWQGPVPFLVGRPLLAQGVQVRGLTQGIQGELCTICTLSSPMLAGPVGCAIAAVWAERALLLQCWQSHLTCCMQCKLKISSKALHTRCIFP